MKLLRFGDAGYERPAVLHFGRTIDVSAEIDDYDAAFFASGGLRRLRELAENGFAYLREAPPGHRVGGRLRTSPDDLPADRQSPRRGRRPQRPGASATPKRGLSRRRG